MIRIVHLSDLHLDNHKMYDAEKFVIKALKEDLRKLNNEKKIDLIVLSGDILNKGSESFNDDIELGFLNFEEKFVEPILKEIGLSNERFFFVPGNHDVNRKADKNIEETGLFHQLHSIEAVNEHMDSGSEDGIRRILPFKEFEKSFYESFGEASLSKYQSCFKFAVGSYCVGVTCFNSAWRSYDSKADKGKILLGERQITNAREHIKDCNVKIGIIHHPLDFLATFENKIVRSFIEKEYDLIFCGHTHDGSAWTESCMHGDIFVSVAPANWSYNIRSSDRINANGYSVIDYDLVKRVVTTHSRRYSHLKECFDPNTDLGDERGIAVFKMSTPSEVNRRSEEIEIADKIEALHFEELNEHLLSYCTETKAPKDIESMFVLPRIVNKVEYNVEEGEKEIFHDLHDLCSSNENIIIFGTKESGKTILLDRLLIELTKNIPKYNKTPVYIDFEEVGHKRFETIISHFLGVGITTVKDYINNHRVILLIDNLSFNQTNIHKLKRLETFVRDNKTIQVIASSNQIIESEVPLEILDYSFFANFKFTNIKSFKTKEIKALMQRWFSHREDFDSSDKLDKLVSAFCMLNLPRTPLAASMFLWIIEQQEDYKPINHATMLENFIMRLFKKLDKKEIYSEEFDYTNKERLLAGIAYEMYKRNLENYRLPYDDLIKFIKEYLRLKKFEFGFSEEDVMQHFISKGIFSKESDGTDTYIRFRFSCFFQYFLMKKMDYDAEFKDYVLNESNFLRFANEIDYFTGLKRDQSEILSLLVKRMNSEYEELRDIINETKDGFDSIYNTTNTLISTLDDTFIKKIKEKEKPKEEELDKIKDEMLETIKPEKGIEKKEVKFSTIQKLEILWTLSAKVLKNTEETDVKNLKNNAYKSVLLCSMAFSSLYKFLLDDYLKKNKNKVNPNISENLMMSKFLPLIHQLVLHELMGTKKLSVVIRENIDDKIKKTETSDLEKFISVFLYSDIHGKNYLKYIEKLLKHIKRPYIYDMVLFKLVTYYFFRSKGKNSDNKYENLIADLIVKSKGLKKINKGEIIENYRKKKRRSKKENDTQLTLF